MEISDALKMSEPFKLIPNDLLNEIGKIAELCFYKEGELVYDVGTKADAVYVVLSGSVKRTVRPPISMITQEKRHGAGDVVGWVSLFQDMPYGLQTWISRIVCLEDSMLIKIDSRKFEDLLENEQEVRSMLRERHAETIINSIMLPGSAVTFRNRGDKKVPLFVPHDRVDRLLGNRDICIAR